MFWSDAPIADGSLYAVDAGFWNMSRNVWNCGVTSRPGSLSDAESVRIMQNVMRAALEEMERADTAFRVILSVHTGLNSLTLLQWANEDQKQRYLVPQARGEKLASFGLTEPGVGSDAANLATTARRDGDRYLLNGSKMWISLADTADSFLVFATVDKAAGHKGITAFIVERGFPGFSSESLHGKLGVRAGNTGILTFSDCEVPVANRVGEEGEGFSIAMSAIDQGRFTVATGAVGLAQACLDASLRYAAERETFGRPIGDFLPVVENDDVIGNLHHHAHIVLDQQQPDLVLVANKNQQLIEFGRFSGIESRRRFIEAKKNRLRAH